MVAGNNFSRLYVTRQMLTEGSVRNDCYCSGGLLNTEPMAA